MTALSPARMSERVDNVLALVELSMNLEVEVTKTIIEFGHDCERLACESGDERYSSLASEIGSLLEVPWSEVSFEWLDKARPEIKAVAAAIVEADDA